jgi:hypothetical protein
VSLTLVSVPASSTSKTYLEGAQQALVDTHHGTCIVKFATVVRRTEQCNELTLREELVAVFYDLMGTANQVHVVFLQEARHNVRTECETDTSVVLAPASDVLVRVGPQEIAEKTAVRDLSKSD